MGESHIKVCPNCHHKYKGYGALSRKGNYEVCSVCGSKEALETCYMGEALIREQKKVEEEYIKHNITGWVDQGVSMLQKDRTKWDSLVYSLILKDARAQKEKVMNVLGRYYDPHIGRFLVPIVDVDTEISKCIIRLIRNGFAMSVFWTSDDAPEDEKFYCIYSIEEDSSGARVAQARRDSIIRCCTNKGQKAFLKVSFEEYFEKELNQVMVDEILRDGNQPMTCNNDDWYIALVCDGANFVFIECLEACY